MPNVVFVAPYFGGQMRKVLEVFAKLEGVRLGVITHEPREAMPSTLGHAQHYRVTNAMDGQQLADATRAFQKEWGRVDRLLGYLEPLQVPLGDARDATGVPGMSGAVARNFRDKNQMKAVLGKNRLPVARQALVKSAVDATRFVAEVGFPIVLKPLDGAGAKNTMRASDHDELYQALNRLMPSEQQPVQAEEFVTGQEHTYETVFIGGEPVWSSSVDYLPGPLAVLENPWMQYCVVLPREVPTYVENFRSTNHAALKALGLHTGLSHMEWFRRADGSVTIGEVGARPPGVNILGLNELVYGVDVWAAWVELMIFDRWTVPHQRRRAAGCAFLRAQGHGGTVRGMVNHELVQKRIGDRIVAAKWPHPGQARSEHYEGDGWVMVAHDTTAGVMEALEELVKTLRVVA
jgi:biotin carboxylase